MSLCDLSSGLSIQTKRFTSKGVRRKILDISSLQVQRTQKRIFSIFARVGGPIRTRREAPRKWQIKTELRVGPA